MNGPSENEFEHQPGRMPRTVSSSGPRPYGRTSASAARRTAAPGYGQKAGTTYGVLGSSSTQRNWHRSRQNDRRGYSNASGADDSTGLGAGGTQLILALQNNLSDALGIDLPRTGQWSAATRRALGKFQRSMGLPVTGRPTKSVMRALRTAAARRQAMPVDDAAAAPDAMPPPEDAAPPLDATPPDAPPEDGLAPEGELPQGEFQLASSGTVMLQRHSTLNLSDPNIGQKLPQQPGLYVISLGPSNAPWYVGTAERGIQDQSRSRWKTLRDFNLGPGDLQGRKITCYTLPATPSIQVSSRHGTSGPLHPRKGIRGILLALQEHFVRNLETAGKGNQQRSSISFGKNVAVNLQILPELPGHPIDSKIPSKMVASVTAASP